MAADEVTEDLARRAAAGDGRALDVLLARVEPMVLRHCHRILPCRQDAEEACQDTLLQVARTITQFEWRSRFTTWLHVVAANCARHTYRSLKRRAAERAEASIATDAPDPRTTSVIAGSRLDLLDALERLEAYRPELVAPIVLRDICQLDYDDIATQLGVPVGTVKSRIHHARAHVRRSLAVRA